MPVFATGPTGEKPKRLRREGKESVLTNILLANPTLLLHPKADKPRQVLWFWKAPKTPGDLWGLDSKGHLVIVEVKRGLGATELRKAVSQLRKASRHRISDEFIQKEWAKLHSRGEVSGCLQFTDEFVERMGHRLHRKAITHLYLVAGHCTRQAAREGARRRAAVILMFEIEIGQRRLVFSERF